MFAMIAESSLKMLVVHVQVRQGTSSTRLSGTRKVQHITRKDSEPVEARRKHLRVHMWEVVIPVCC
jgi:hypothetical protein